MNGLTALNTFGEIGNFIFQNLSFERDMDLICFDLDNTLINSEKAHVYAYNYALKKNCLPEWKFKDMVGLFGRPHGEVVSILIHGRDRAIIKRIKIEHDRVLVQQFFKYSRVKKGVRRILAILNKKYRLAIVSNASHRSIVALLHGAGLERSFFSALIGNDDVAHSKPYPDEIFTAEKLIHARARYIIGDSPYDIIAGKLAHVVTIGLLSGRYSKKQLESVKTDYIIKNLSGVLRILK